MVTMQDLATKHNPNWCPGCGDHAILAALKGAIVDVGVEPHKIAAVSGIGCGSNLPGWLNTYGFMSLHGRSLPVATGIKLANKDLTVIAVGGDGDGFGIGLGHFIHTVRRNIDMTYITQDNQVYGLTTGQTSPTSAKGMKTKSTPMGVLEEPINPLELAIVSGATYVARAFAGDVVHMRKLIADGIRHKGFALVDVFQPCVSFNKINTYDFFKQNVYKLEDVGHDPADREAAMRKAFQKDKLPIGLFYKTTAQTYEDGLPQMAQLPLVKHDIRNVDISVALKEFM
ncbi:2-oxoglutarate synthase subunit KorB [uncultured archaeon]|nr:2-oxoglutarate synthase subunit KorB [uncultured archaeon]